MKISSVGDMRHDLGVCLHSCSTPVFVCLQRSIQNGKSVFLATVGVNMTLLCGFLCFENYIFHVFFSTVLPQLDSNVIINYKSGPNARQVHININKSWRIRQNVKTDECWSYYKNPLVYPKAKQYLCVCAGWSNILNAKHGHFSCRQTQLAAIWPISDCHDRTPEKCKYTNTQRQIQRHKYKYTNTNTQIQLAVIWPISDSRDRTPEKYNFKCLYEKHILVCLK